MKVDALVVEECRRITTYLKGYSYPKLYCKKLRNQKPKANTVSFSTRRTTFFSDKFFKQCDRVGKTKKIYTCCNLALKPLLEFLNQLKCKRNEVTEERRR